MIMIFISNFIKAIQSVHHQECTWNLLLVVSINLILLLIVFYLAFEEELKWFLIIYTSQNDLQDHKISCLLLMRHKNSLILDCGSSKDLQKTFY